MKHLVTQLNTWLPVLGSVSFGIGVIASLFQGGFIAACFVIALVSGAGIFALDYYASGFSTYQRIDSMQESKILLPRGSEAF